MKKPLSLHQELTLLSLHDSKGTLHGYTFVTLLPTAMLAELSLRGRIRIKDKKVELLNDAPTDDELLNEVLEKIAKDPGPKSIATWISTLGENSTYSCRIIQQLCDRKILRKDVRRVLGLFPIKRYPLASLRVEQAIRARMAKLMFGRTIQHDVRTTLLICLAHKAKLLRRNFNTDRLSRNQRRIRKIAAGKMYLSRAPRLDQLALGPTVKMAAQRSAA